MSTAHDHHDDGPNEQSRRVMARVALRRISDLVTRQKLDEEQDALLAKRVPLFIFALIGLCFVVAFFRWAIFDAHPKMQLFAVSLLAGLSVGAILIIANKKRKK
jgi:hypothetical protein